MEEAQRAQEEIDRRKTTGHVFRFYVPKGEETEIIILDKSLDDCVALYEHNLQGPDGKWSVYEPCLKDFGHCPICATGSSSYYGLQMSVLVLRAFRTKNGKDIPWSKMLMTVKVGGFDTFRRLEAAAIKECGTMRGMYLVMGRSATNDKAAKIGDPVMQEGGKLYEMLDEDTLDADYGHDAVLGQDKKVLRPANFDITPFDYRVLFPMPELPAESGGRSAPSGSQAEANKAFEEDSLPDVPNPSSRRTRPGTAAPSAPAAEPAAEAPRRRRRESAATPENPFGA